VACWDVIRFVVVVASFGIRLVPQRLFRWICSGVTLQVLRRILSDVYQFTLCCLAQQTVLHCLLCNDSLGVVMFDPIPAAALLQ
jgi:hypothetical protein